MKIILFGLGSIGQRHADILLKKYKHDLYAFRSGTKNTPNKLGIKELHSWNEVEKLRPDVAFITNPTSLHIETAGKCAEIGCKLFIEKPIGSSLKEFEKFKKIIADKKLVTYIAYNLRFHPVINKLKEYIRKGKFFHMSILTTSYYPNWKHETDYKKRYSANSNLGGGIVLDLSHEIDYTNYLLGEVESIKGQFSRRSDLTVDTEDYADMIIKTERGPSNIHTNFFSQKRQRIIQIDFKGLTVIGDLLNSNIEEYKNEKMLSKEHFEMDSNYTYEKQIEYFFENIDNPDMMNNLLMASNLFEKIIAFKNHE